MGNDIGQHLSAWLQMAVPLHIAKIDNSGDPNKHDWEAARRLGTALAEKGAEAVPPAYTEFIGRQMLKYLRR